jgi:hypothetical protein
VEGFVTLGLDRRADDRGTIAAAGLHTVRRELSNL